VVALTAAGAEAQGADLYVTPETCAHLGRTPPCIDAIIRAGIPRSTDAVSSSCGRRGSPSTLALVRRRAQVCHIVSGGIAHDRELDVLFGVGFEQ
jgi:diaminohydroxyphosphoribosylaminopyrimidine deaminase/5-amino-6-(5-phosphoribosylamino)uracil reductase